MLKTWFEKTLNFVNRFIKFIEDNNFDWINLKTKPGYIPIDPEKLRLNQIVDARFLSPEEKNNSPPRKSKYKIKNYNILNNPPPQKPKYNFSFYDNLNIPPPPKQKYNYTNNNILNIPPPLTPIFEISNNNFNIDPISLPRPKIKTKKLPIQPIPQEQIKNEIQYLQNYIKNNPNNTTFIKEKLDKLRIQYLMSFHKPTLNNFGQSNMNKWRGFHPKNLNKILAVIYNDISRDSWEKLNPKKEEKSIIMKKILMKKHF